MEVECEGCIIFAICVHQIKCIRNCEHTFNYKTYWNEVFEKCNYAHTILTGSDRDKYDSFKKFFLKEKGLI